MLSAARRLTLSNNADALRRGGILARMDVAVAFGMTLLAGLATGVGGLYVALKRTPSDRFLAGSLGFSAGVMLYISLVELLGEGVASISEGSSHAELKVTVAFFAGMAAIALIDRLVPGGTGMRRVGVVTALAIAVHNFPEGIATFVSALADPVMAMPIAVAIAIHNIPEGIAVAVPLREATGSKWKAAGWATLSGLAEPLGAALGYLLLRPVMGPQTLGYAFAAIAGVMVFVSVDKLLPTALATDRHEEAVYGAVGGMAVMAASLLLLG